MEEIPCRALLINGSVSAYPIFEIWTISISRESDTNVHARLIYYSVI